MTVKYIIGHWTGVNFYGVTPAIKQSYQLLIDGYGNVIDGTRQGLTASTGGMNSITYNIACCGGDVKAPMTKKQCERFFKECAKALKKYNLSADRFYTHAEIGQMVRNGTITKLLPKNKWLYQNVGKIDLTCLPYDFKGQSHGDFIRNKIKWYLGK